jgi:hypothetical protein
MNFKEWLDINEARLKGFQKQFLRMHPNMPAYVAHQLYTNKLGPALAKSIKNYDAVRPTILAPQSPVGPLSPTVDHDSFVVSSPMPSPHELLNDEFIKSIQWEKKPKVIELSPLDFDEGTLGLFLRWRFGFAPKDNLVRNDSNRFDVQRQMLADRIKEDNEPIILVKDGNKWRLLEGYHRTMTYLLWPHEPQPGAPPDQMAVLEKGDDNKLDLTKWARVPIKAYIGIKSELAA